jgi:hypothetical protein
LPAILVRSAHDLAPVGLTTKRSAGIRSSLISRLAPSAFAFSTVLAVSFAMSNPLEPITPAGQGNVGVTEWSELAH